MNGEEFKGGWQIDLSPEHEVQELDGNDWILSDPVPYYNLTITYDGENVLTMRGAPGSDGTHFTYGPKIEALAGDLNRVDVLRKLQGPAVQRIQGYLMTWFRGLKEQIEDGKTTSFLPPAKDLVAVVLDLVHADDAENPKELLVQRVAAAMKSEMGPFMGAEDAAWDHWARAIVAKTRISLVDSDSFDGRPLWRLEED